MIDLEDMKKHAKTIKDEFEREAGKHNLARKRLIDYDDLLEILDRAITAEKAVEILAEIIENCDDCMDNCPLWYECDKIDIDERESSCANNLKNYAMEKAREQECLKG